MEQSLHYYVDGLGCQMTRHWLDDGKLRWCWLDFGAAALMLQEYRTEGHDSWTPDGKVGLGVTISFQCSDAIALYHAFKPKGIEVSRPFVGNGMWVITVIDPDGYRLEFESLTSVPDGTEYTE
jgi:catechol 2,3-dioxygenase-like lactoylglutathione lyase family enzyme